MVKRFKQYIKELDYSKNARQSSNVLDTTSNKEHSMRHDIDTMKLNSTLFNKSSDRTDGQVSPPKRAPLQPPRETVIMKGERN